MVNYLIETKRGNGGSPKNWVVFCLALALLTVALNGCGNSSDDNNGPLPTYTSEITSDINADGDIGLAPNATYTISSALDTGTVIAGIDPETGDEFRGFLDFPLQGSHGIPQDATIESATLEIHISGMSTSPPDGFFPFMIDLVDFQPPMLITTDFNRVVQPSLLTMPFDFFPSDVGHFVVIDVTALMEEAQINGLPDFQLRFLLDFSVDSGLIEIDDSDLKTAPFLTVVYS